MPFVTVQLGQCGNQIGTEFFQSLLEDAFKRSGCPDKAEEEYRHEVTQRFFHEGKLKHGGNTFFPRSVLVDMEPKVIAQSVINARSSGYWQYSSKQQFLQQSGSGNNWAYGYCMLGPRCQAGISDIIRKQVEQCDRFDGFMCLMSLAGGTGSGMGTFVTEMLRDEYPRRFILNQVVMPYQTGEVIVQSYNALLTLSHLYQASDGLIMLENDHIQQICLRRMGLKQVSFTHLNHVIAHKMVGLLAPAQRNGSKNHLGNYMEELFYVPSYKLSSLLTLPIMSQENIKFSTFQWSPILKTLHQMLIAKAHMEEGINWGVKIRPQSDYNRSLSNLLIVRGKGSDSQDISTFSQAGMYPSWALNTVTQYSSQRPIRGYEKTASLLTNSQLCLQSIDKIIGKAWCMYTSRAYIHQYTKHGLTDENFLNCFTSMEKAIQDYRMLGS